MSCDGWKDALQESMMKTIDTDLISSEVEVTTHQSKGLSSAVAPQDRSGSTHMMRCWSIVATLFDVARCNPVV